MRHVIAALGAVAILCGGMTAAPALPLAGATLVAAAAGGLDGAVVLAKSKKSKAGQKGVKSTLKKAKAKARKAKAKAAKSFSNPYKVGKGETVGPVTVTNPPYDAVINDGTITNGGQSGVPALTTEGNVTVINNGTITATGGGGSTSSAVGVSMY